MSLGQVSGIQARNHVVAVGERLARDGDADGGGAGGDEPGARVRVGWEGGVGRVSGCCRGGGGGGGDGGGGRHC